MTLRYKEIHDCQKPSMVIGELIKTRASFFGLRTETEVVPLYEEREVEFTCPDCGAVWSYPFGDHGWFCESRPEKWVDGDKPPAMPPGDDPRSGRPIRSTLSRWMGT